MEETKVSREDFNKIMLEQFLEDEAGVVDLFEFYKRIEESYTVAMHHGTDWVHSGI